MKNLFLITVLSALLVGCHVRVSKDVTIDAADEAYNNLDLKKSRDILNAILKSDEPDAETKCKTLQKLARQDWKFYKDSGAARKRLAVADSIGALKSKTWLILAQTEREAGNYLNAFYASEKSKQYGQTDEEKSLADLEYAQAVYDFTIDNPIKKNSLDTALLTKSAKILNEVLEKNMGAPVPSKLLLGVSLLLNNGADALKAWQSYFHISDINNPYPYMSVAAKELKEVCEKWNGNKLTIEDQQKLISALGASRFYEFAGDYALCNADTNKYNQQTADILTYAAYIKTLRNKTNEYYRQIAIGNKDENGFMYWLDNAGKKLWNNLSFLSGKAYDQSNLLDETEKHFGARGFFGSTSNYNGYELCLGHIVNQENLPIEQYGYKTEITFTQIDLMISNGYSSYFWENGKAIGGWGTGNWIVQVREAYLKTPFDAWKTVTDTLERNKVEKITKELSEVKQNPDFNKLSAKLKFDALNNLYNKLYADGLRGNALKLTFLSVYESYEKQASVLAHEGRHCLDQKYFKNEYYIWPNVEKEFHAKLSELVFAPEPKLELSMMLGDLSQSGHGLANKKIADAAADWIKNNSSKINGYSTEISPLSQLYLLSNDQIKQCYSSVDPLNKK
jgi:hypothetical protein